MTAVTFPRVALIRQRLNTERIADIPTAVAAQLDAVGAAQIVRPGMRVAVTVGSRGIASIPIILRAVVDQLRALGAEPFVFPAMGSHGGALAEGQLQVLESLGITEQSVGCPIISSLEVDQIGVTPEGIPVYVDRVAHQADGIVVVNRIKPHTDFTGPIESGLVKMMVIGLGKYKGAETVHAHAVRLGLAQAIPSVARVVMANCRILFGLAVLENAFHQVGRIIAVPTAEIESRERELLPVARHMLGSLPVDDLDVLVVDEVGKEVSGTGMDTHVIGRIRIEGMPEPTRPRITRIVLRDLSPHTHGNAIGIGLADFTTRRAVDKIDYRSTYINVITGVAPARAYIPIISQNDREALERAMATIGAVSPEQSRLAWIRNTQELERLYVSETVLNELQGRADIEQLEPLAPLPFDDAGNMVPNWIIGEPH